jgi:probable rRNA maturation factor
VSKRFRSKKACDPSGLVASAIAGSSSVKSPETFLDKTVSAGVRVTVRNLQRTIPVPDAWRCLIRDAAAQCLHLSSFPHPAAIHVDIVGNRAMANLNRQFRKRNGVTDVLSFPILHYRSGMPVLVPGDCDPVTGEVFLGDIVICLPRMRLQADAFGHGMERELGFLAAHGMLHLLGYDHETTEEEHRMFRLQETALSAMGLSRLEDD